MFKYIEYLMFMDPMEFRGSVAGEIRWAMNGAYCYFHPHDLPYDWICSRDSLSRMKEASVELARLDGMMRFLDPEMVRVLTMNLSLMESASSSSIEGTRSTVEDIFLSERVVERNESRARDNREVENYRKALLFGFERLPVGGRITVGLIKDLHRVLMEGTRGADKSPGEFKTHQNAIGIATDTLESAEMVPASQESVDFLMDNWVKYVNSDNIDTVEKVVLSHYQFEAIHPFRDGNGRVGRLLVMMILRRDGLLRYPMLHLSGYMNLNRSTYIGLMHRVSTDDAIDDWIGFFSEGLRSQSITTAGVVDSLIRYRDKLRDSAADILESRTVDLLFMNPYVNSKGLAESLGVSLPTANRILERLESAGVLREATGKKRNRLYVADGILELLR